jgi:hypothetical protein
VIGFRVADIELAPLFKPPAGFCLSTSRNKGKNSIFEHSNSTLYRVENREKTKMPKLEDLVPKDRPLTHRQHTLAEYIEGAKQLREDMRNKAAEKKADEVVGTIDESSSSCTSSSEDEGTFIRCNGNAAANGNAANGNADG